MPRLVLLAAFALAATPTVASAACARSTTWDAFVRCNLRKQKFEIVRELPAAKLVSFDSGYSPDVKRFELYVQVDGVWMRNSYYADNQKHSELLGFDALAPDTYRIEIGHAVPQWVTLDEASMRPALLRRRHVHVCTGTTACRRVMASCEVLVHGKRIAGYRGEPIWDGATLKLRADMRAQNRYCATPRNLVIEEPQ